jgi:hypothetical protein
MHDLQFHLAATLNTLRKIGFFPYLLPRSLAGEIREGEQAVIYHQPAKLGALVEPDSARWAHVQVTIILVPCAG